MHKILIIEDDETISGAIKSHIETWGCQAECVQDFRTVLAQFVEYAPQLILLDISLPLFNGYHWCSEIRKISKVPIVFLSSASDAMNIVMAMNMGGDDFIAKPFDLQVMTAKIQAVLRRTYNFGAASNLIEHRGAIINLSDATLLYGEHKLELTKNNNKILQTLLENKGTIVSRDTLMMKLWETNSFVDENTLTVNITRLRQKLQNIGLADFIVTKKGSGYLVE